jgi:mycofactocin system glycosyltransferase
MLILADHRTRLWRDGRTALGGAPWGVVRLGPAAAGLLRRALTARPSPVLPADALEAAAAKRLVERGLVHPAPHRADRTAASPDIDVVVPAYGRADLLERCLRSLRGCRVLVVDDASPTDDVTTVALAQGARLVRHPRNRGPAAARNSGLAATSSAVVAFVDADCVAPQGWLARLAPHFDDPRVGAVAPRVVPRISGRSVLARHEAARSALDMGAEPALVRPGGQLGFLPSATLLVRRESLPVGGFDEHLRLGEDVNLVWRLADAGWYVRYDPSVLIQHEMRVKPVLWMRRRYEYGTSAADLDVRHPGRLAPMRTNVWNAVALAGLGAGRPAVAALTAGVAGATLARTLRRSGVDPTLAVTVVAKGLVADAAALGHALRREWWPLGWAALALASRRRTARAAAVVMLVPIALEWVRGRPGEDLVRYAALRLLEDAAYGSGVIVSAARGRRLGPLLPEVRLPGGATERRAASGRPSAVG